MKGLDIREKRIELKLTQQQLSDQTGVPLGTIARLESTNSTVKKVEVLEKLDAVLGIMKDRVEKRLEDKLAEAEAEIALQKQIEESDSLKINRNIPMYNFPVAAGGIETYMDENDVKIVGHLNIPGAHKDSVAIPAYGDSMYPTLSNGDWAVSRPISDPTEIVWGELYYIEWSDYKMYKRLLHAENSEEVILWSDNQLDQIGDRPKFAPMTIKKEKIRKLRLVTEILKKPNY